MKITLATTRPVKNTYQGVSNHLEASQEQVFFLSVSADFCTTYIWQLIWSLVWWPNHWGQISWRIFLALCVFFGVYIRMFFFGLITNENQSKHPAHSCGVGCKADILKVDFFCAVKTLVLIFSARKSAKKSLKIT